MFPQIFGKYVLEGEIAVGGMARVFLAKLRGAGGFEKRLVVKQILTELASQEDFVARFVAEAKTAVELTHPNIVPVYELGVEAGVYFIAMEYCDGVTLAELLSATGPLSAEEGAHVGAEILGALDYAHRRAGIVHRDVTPRNVLVDDEGTLRLIDFGIATGVNGERARVFGSPGHMPLEQLRGEPLTPSADVFAVGALLLEAWTGRAPFRRDTPEASRQALAEPLPTLEDPNLAPLSDHVRRSLAPRPEERPASAEDMARPLRAFNRDRDAKDIARALGERARRTRAAKRSPAPSATTPSDAGSPLSSPSARSQTFATRRLPALAGSSEREPGTRPLAVPASRGSEDLPARREKSAARLRLAALAVVVAGGASILALSGSRGASVSGGGSVSPDASSVRPLSAPRRSEAAAQAPVGAGSAPRSSAPVGETELHPRATAPAMAPREVPSSPEAPRAPANPTAGELTLTADPPSEVRIAGKVFTTPVAQARVPPGHYEVVFRHAAWPEALRTPVEVVSGTRLRVHADFTQDPPRIWVR